MNFGPMGRAREAAELPRVNGDKLNVADFCDDLPKLDLLELSDLERVRGLLPDRSKTVRQFSAPCRSGATSPHRSIFRQSKAVFVSQTAIGPPPLGKARSSLLQRDKSALLAKILSKKPYFSLLNWGRQNLNRYRYVVRSSIRRRPMRLAPNHCRQNTCKNKSPRFGPSKSAWRPCDKEQEGYKAYALQEKFLSRHLEHLHGAYVKVL